MRLTIDLSSNQYSLSLITPLFENSASEMGAILSQSQIIFQSHDEQNNTYTGLDWNGESLTLESTGETGSGDDGDEQSAGSESQLINVGIMAAIIVIVLSLMAIQSMRNQDE